MSRLATTILMIAAICALCVAGPVAATTWDAAGEFSGTNAGIWQYGYCADGQLASTAFTAYSVYGVFAGVLDEWSNDTNDGLSNGAIWKNSSANTLQCPWPATYAAGQLGYHSGLDLSRPTVRWTAPVTGWVFVSASASGADYADVTSTQGNLRLNGTVLWSANVNGYGGTPPDYTGAFGASPSVAYSNTIFVTAGDTLDFVGGSQGAIPGDATRIAYTITTVPEPSALVALFAGVTGFCGVAFRRRKS